MADNTVLNPGIGGDTIATDDVGGVKYQRGKRSLGPDGTAVDAALTYHAVAAASTNAVNIKNSLAHLWSVHVFNNAAYAIYVKFYNKATAPSPGSDTPVLSIGVQAGAQRDLRFSPANFATGLGIAMVKNIVDSDNTPLLLSDCTVDVEYV